MNTFSKIYIAADKEASVSGPSEIQWASVALIAAEKLIACSVVPVLPEQRLINNSRREQEKTR